MTPISFTKFTKFICMMCMIFVAQSTNAQSLVDRFDKIQKHIEKIKQYNSVRMNVIIEEELNVGEKPYADIQEGSYVFLSDKILFDGMSYSGCNLNECLQKKTMGNEECVLRTITVPGRMYIQSGDVNADDIISSVVPGGRLHNKPMYVLRMLEEFIDRMKDKLETPDKDLMVFLGDVKNEDGTSVIRYEVKVPLTDISDSISYFDFPKDHDFLLPVFMASETCIKASGKSFWDWTLSIKTDRNSILGYCEYEFKSYHINKKNFDEKAFVENPVSYLENDRFTHVLIKTLPMVNVAVFPDEFNFFIPKGKALILHDESGAEPQRILAEEDRLFTP